MATSTNRSKAQAEAATFLLPVVSIYGAEVRNGGGAVMLRIDPPTDASTLLLWSGAPKSKGGSWGSGQPQEPEDELFLSELALVPEGREAAVALATLRRWLPHVALQGPAAWGAARAGTLRLGDIELTARDARLLGDERCLNDTALDFFLRLTVEVVAPDSLKDDLYVASSFFFQKLTSNNVASGAEGWHNVARWTRGLAGGLLEKRFVLVPVNEQNLHWWLAVVCYPGRALESGDLAEALATQGEMPRIVCLDSALEPPPKARATAFLRGYLWREWCERNPERAPLAGGVGEEPLGLAEGASARMLRSVIADVPKQENGYDCGIFIIEYLLHLLQSRSALRGLGLAPHQHWFTQGAVSHRRKRLRWLVGCLQAEAKRRAEPEVARLLQDDGLRAAVIGALSDLPRASGEGALAAEPLPPTRAAREFSPELAGLKRKADVAELPLEAKARQPPPCRRSAVHQLPLAAKAREPLPPSMRSAANAQSAALAAEPAAGRGFVAARSSKKDSEVLVGEAIAEGLDAPGAAFALLSN